MQCFLPLLVVVVLVCVMCMLHFHSRRPAPEAMARPAAAAAISPSLFHTHRALKTKHETPKYGLIYHASLIGQSQPKFKGKISRVLAAKCALAIRVDALGDTTDASVGLEAREKVCVGLWVSSSQAMQPVTSLSFPKTVA